MTVTRRFQGAGGEVFWAISNHPACSECDRLSLSCVSRVASSGSCYQCSRRRAGCTFSRTRFVPTSLRGSGFLEDPDSVRRLDSSHDTPVLARNSRPQGSPQTPRSTSRSAARYSTSPSESPGRRVAPYIPARAPSTNRARESRSASEVTLDLDRLSIPDTQDPIFLDLTAPGPARPMSVADSLSVLSRTPSRSPSLARSSSSNLSFLSRSPSAPLSDLPPSPRTMKERRLSRLSKPTEPRNPFNERF